MIDSLQAFLTKLNLRRSQVILLASLGAGCLVTWCCLATVIIGGLPETETSPTELAAPSEVTVEAIPEVAPTPEVVPEATLLPMPTPEATPTPAETLTSTLAPMPSPINATVKADALNMREGPGTGYAIVGKLAQGDVATVIGQNSGGDWLKVEHEGQTGWVAKEYVDVPAEVTTVPVAEVPPTPMAVPSTDTPTPPERVQAQVIQVIDGDTIEVDIGGQTYKVRYIGVDTPETKHPDKPVEPFGPEAAAKNEELVGGKIVELEKDVSETDQYGRLLRYVWVGDLMVNAELVRLGYAQISTYPPDVKYQDIFLQLQQEARDAGRGLWGQPEPEPTEPAAPPPPSGAAEVIIQYVFYDGVVPRVESDEYAEIANVGATPVDIGGWLLNAGDPGQDFVFPGFVLQPGQVCRVYTNEHHPDSCGFSFGSSKAIWNNKGDCGYLYNTNGELVSKYCY